MSTIPVSLASSILANKAYDVGTTVGTTSYAIPSFTVTGNPETVTYTSFIAPSTSTITFNPSTLITSWSSSTPVGFYFISIVGTTSPSMVSAVGTFMLQITNACTSATVTTSV